MYIDAFKCSERRGLYIRVVKEVQPTAQVIWDLMVKLSPISSPVKDLRMLQDPRVRILLVDEVGVLIKGPLTNYKGWPDVHIGFWDKILVGREEMCYIVGQRLAADAHANGLWTAIPKSARTTIAFAKRVGFTVVRESDLAYGMEISFHDETRG